MKVCVTSRGVNNGLCSNRGPSWNSLLAQIGAHLGIRPILEFDTKNVSAAALFERGVAWQCLPDKCSFGAGVFCE
jgi:hypothetical protein